MADREFMLKILADVSAAKRDLGKMEDDVSKLKTGFDKTAKAVGGLLAAGALVGFGKSIVSAASDQEQAIGAVNSVFGEYAEQIHGFGATTARELGISQAEFSQLSTLTGALLKNAGVPMQEVTDSTVALTERAADLAAMYGGTVPDALAAINSGLKGEMDPLERFGVSLKASAIEAKAAAMGYLDAEGNVTDYGKQMARVELIMEQSSDAAGTFANESGTLAGQTAIMKAQFKDLQADLGSKLLPVIVTFADKLRGLIDFVVRNQSWLVPTVAAIGGMVLIIKAWQMATAAWTVVTQFATAIQTAFNAAMAMNPIGLIIIAVAALVAGFILLYKNSETFREIVDAVVKAVTGFFWGLVDTVKEIGEVLWDIVMAYTWPWRQAIEIIIEIIERIAPVFRVALDAITRILSTVWSIVSYPFTTAYNLIKSTIELIPGIVTGVVTSITTALVNVMTTLSQPFVDGANKAIDFVGDILDAVWEVPGKVYEFMAGTADALYGPFEAAFDWIKNAWNDTVGGFGFSVPSWVPGVGGKKFEIPRMASGGIVTGPTIALLGEAGPEAVIPLSRGMGGSNVTINVYALTANAEVGRKVWEALREYDRTSGKGLGIAG